jgi:hypothetical protein
LEVKLEDYLNTYGGLYFDVKKHSKIIYDPTDLNCSSNPLNVDFVPIKPMMQSALYKSRQFINLLKS